MKPESPIFQRRTLDELTIGDERSFRHVALYADLKEVLRRAQYPFRILPTSHAGRADRALLLNLTFWGADAGGDVLIDENIEADVVTHAAWHHLASRAFAAAPGQKPAVNALFLGEAIASAFDVYLVGRLLGHAPKSSFLASQVPAMADVAADAGMDEAAFERFLEALAADPDLAFTNLRALLSDVTASLFACNGAEEALAALSAFDAHPSAPLLHRFELSNWVLYARAYGDPTEDARAAAVDRSMRAHQTPLDWLAEHWVAPALT